MKYELKCRYDTRQSFYGKAKVEEQTTTGEHGKTILKNLYSYGALVAKILYAYIDNTTKITYLYMGKYSQTTTRHQKEFFRQNGLTEKEIKELFDKVILEKEC